MFIINVKQVIKSGVAELLSLGVGNDAPEIEIRNREKVEEKFEVFSLLGQKFQNPDLFSIQFQMLYKILDVIMFLPVFHTEYDANGIGLFICRARAQALVFTEGRLGSPS